MYSIPSENLPGIMNKIEKLNRKAAKLGCPPIVVTVHGTEDVLDGGNYYRFRSISVEGKSPVISGWHLVSVLNHVTTENGREVVVRTVPGEELPESYHSADPDNCDHCHMIRRRTDTFVLENSGTFKQVGRQCLADFLGSGSVESLLAYAQLWAGVQEDLESGGGGNRRVLLSLRDYLAVVSVVIRVDGWMSKGRAWNENRQSTSERAHVLYYKSEPEYSVMAQDYDISSKALTWARELDGGLDGLSDYLHNVHVVAGMPGLSEKHMGIAASIIPAYQRTVERKAAVKLVHNSEHFGTVGKRETFSLTVMGVREVEGKYGVTFIHHMATQDGNLAVWFSSTGALENGATYRLTSSVKEHSVYNGVNQTVLTRCKVS